MDKVQQSRVRMFLAVQKVCEKYQDELKTNPKGESILDKFVSLNEAIQASIQLQVVDLTGIAQDKNTAKVKMAKQAYVIAQTLTIIADENGNRELLEKVNYRKDELLRSSELRSKEKCELILQKARKFEPELEAYGITSDKISDLEQAIEDFAILRAKPRVAIVARKRATSQLRRFIFETSYLLRRRLDTLMLQFEETNFFEEYTSARIIIDPGVNNPNEEAGQPEPETGNGTIALQ